MKEEINYCDSNHINNTLENCFFCKNCQIQMCEECSWLHSDHKVLKIYKNERNPSEKTLINTKYY